MPTNKNLEKKYLFVDLDGSLIKTDLLHETFLSFFKINLFAPLHCLINLLSGGIAGLKSFLYKNSDICISTLPYDRDVLNFINSWRDDNKGEVILISASDDRLVQKISEHLNVFDASYGTIDVNLKSKNKLKKIRQLSNGSKFDYIGNSFDDLIILKESRAPVIVNPSFLLEKKLQKHLEKPHLIQNKIYFAKSFIKLIRMHQWIKNLLLFVPMILSNLFSIEAFTQLVFGFTSFSMVASAFYIFNDQLDLESDRNHLTKKYRPLASGEISLFQGALAIPILLTIAGFISLNLNQDFQIILAFYGLSTFLYSKYLKRIAMLDILILSLLYLLRILAGAMVLSIELSNWLVTFSVFFFLFLASLKRHIEIKKSLAEHIPSRGYSKNDEGFIFQLSSFSGLISVLVICLYVDSQEAQAIYSSVNTLWLIPLILLYWVMQILFNANRDIVDDDPVVYVLKDRTSYCCLGLFFLIFLSAL